ncbi:outer membrane protein transport protein [Chryseobacterium formosus]|uniref:Outer membrane protein transport protein n=1 Tax=Chryseobacterium formosus TaxID=1537363 RepID=A0ABT3XNH4_9FLAO|nr:hemin receptor [Chryseobacterium formosus]MCX8523683.1 outer membrane protein transport protein [Chryseobacterium formosus]
MLKKSLVLMGVTAAFYLQAQDISVIRNSIDVYSNTPMTGSSKFNAMAGSNGALGGDATALLTNPAGLGVAIAGDASVTLAVGGNKNTSSLAGSSVNYNINKVNIGNLGGVATFQLMSESPWKFVTLGANLSTQSIENYVESPGNGNVSIAKNLVDNSGNPVVGNLSYLGHAYNRYGTQTKFNIGVGANYNNALYVGASVNMHYVDLEQYDSAKFGLNLDNTAYSFDKQYTPYSEKSNGFSASVGVIGKITKEFRLGASIESPTWWSLDRIYTDYYTGTDGYIYADNFVEDRRFQSPMKATLSGAFVPSKNFAINVDYTLGLTKPRYKVQGDAESELNSFFSDSYKNLSEIKVGAEYRIKAIRLRGGYSYASSPFDAMTISAYSNNGQTGDVNYSNLILGDRNTIGAGIGYDFGKFYIDAAYQNITSEYKNPFLSGNESFGTGYYSGDFDVATPYSVVSDVKNVRNNFFLTVGWKF